MSKILQTMVVGFFYLLFFNSVSAAGFTLSNCDLKPTGDGETADFVYTVVDPRNDGNTKFSYELKLSLYDLYLLNTNNTGEYVVTKENGSITNIEIAKGDYIRTSSTLESGREYIFPEDEFDFKKLGRGGTYHLEFSAKDIDSGDDAVCNGVKNHSFLYPKGKQSENPRSPTPINDLEEFGEIKMNHDQTVLEFELPYDPELYGFEYSYVIKATYGDCNEGKCRKEGKVDVVSKPTSEFKPGIGYISIGDLAPIDTTAEKRLTAPFNNFTVQAQDTSAVSYTVVLYIDCSGDMCSLKNYKQNFSKTLATSPSGSSVRKKIHESDNQSNVGPAACNGSLDCANCIGRVKVSDTETRFFTSFDEAACLYDRSIDGCSGYTGDFIFTNYFYTSIGCIDPSPSGIVVRMIQIALGISGFVILIRFGQAAFMLQKGNPEEYKEGVSIAVSALLALLMIVLAMSGLVFLGMDLFKVFSPGTLVIT